MTRKRVLAAALVAAGALLAGCFSGSSGPSGQDNSGANESLPPDAGPPQPGGTYTYSTTTEAPSLDMHKAASAYTQASVSGIVYSKLLEFKVGRDIPYGSMDVQGDLAESWKRSEDGKTWTFNLRHGVKWQNIAPVNGREFTSADVACTMNRIQTLPGVQANLLTVVSSVDTPDDYTVVFHLKDAYAAFDETMAHYYMAILPCEGTRGEFNLAEQAIGTGPFILQTWNRKVDKVYVKNPDYFIKGQPYVDRLHQVIITDPAASLAAYRSGQLDATTTTETLLPTVKSTNPDAVIRRLMGTTEGLTFMNQNVKPFDDIRVRKAIALAMDRDGEAKAFSPPDYQLSGPIPPLLFGGMTPDESADRTPYDPEKAKQLLAEAGYPNGFSVTMTTSDGWGPYIMNRAQWLQEDLKKVGITTELKVLDYATFYSTWAAEDYELGFGYLTAMMSADEYLASTWRSDGTRNWFNINDPKLDSLIDQQRGMLDADDREDKLMEINDYILDNVANPIMSYLVSSLSVRQPYVHDVWSHPEYGATYVKWLWVGPEAPGRG